MKGAKADPSVTTINRPNKTSVTTMGPSHHFFRILKKPQRSLRTAILPIVNPLLIQLKFFLPIGVPL